MTLDRKNPNGNYEPSNCRWANASTQIFNTNKRSDNTSGVVGVNWHKVANKWMASITVKSKTIYLGLHDEKIDAIKARQAGELEYYGSTKISF